MLIVDSDTIVPEDEDAEGDVNMVTVLVSVAVPSCVTVLVCVSVLGCGEVYSVWSGKYQSMCACAGQP